MKTQKTVNAITCDKCGCDEIIDKWTVPKIKKCIVCGKDACADCSVSYESTQLHRPPIRICIDCLSKVKL